MKRNLFISLFFVLFLVFFCKTQKITAVDVATNKVDTVANLGLSQYAYKAIQIMKPSADHNNLEICLEGIEKIQKILKKIAVVAVVGPYHSGKSFLLNAYINYWRGQNENAKKDFQQRMTNNNTEIFHVAEHVDPSTMGIWLVETDIVLPDGSTVLFMDTEGFFGKCFA
jgi:hypothetical protein